MELLEVGMKIFGFVTVTASIVVMDSEIDAYLKENNLCDLADRRDAEDEERRMEA